MAKRARSLMRAIRTGRIAKSDFGFGSSASIGPRLTEVRCNAENRQWAYAPVGAVGA